MQYSVCQLVHQDDQFIVAWDLANFLVKAIVKVVLNFIGTCQCTCVATEQGNVSIVCKGILSFISLAEMPTGLSTLDLSSAMLTAKATPWMRLSFWEYPFQKKV